MAFDTQKSPIFMDGWIDILIPKNSENSSYRAHLTGWSPATSGVWGSMTVNVIDRNGIKNVLVGNIRFVRFGLVDIFLKFKS